jgi:hypothetical protein
MDASTSFQGFNISLSYLGQIDLSRLTTSINTLEDVGIARAQGTLNGTVQSSLVKINGENAALLTTSPSRSIDDFAILIDSRNLAEMKRVLNGDDVYITSSAAGDSNSYFLYDGNDIFYHNHILLKYNDLFYGGNGTDKVVFDKVSTGFTIKAGSVWNELTQKSDLTGFTLTDNNKLLNTLQVNEVERLQFSDTSIALDTQAGQNGGMAWRMYKAALNRAPDDKGLGDWISVLDKGANKISVLAAGFTGSAEFQARYGTTLSTKDFVGLLYKNVLGRSPAGTEDQGWIDAINVRGASREEVLFGFSESPENINYSLTLIGNGAKYIEHVG